jgi:cardiolipin synthase
VVEGNALRLLTDGRERMEALVALIDGAGRSVRLLYYIFEDDAAGRALGDAMVRAAARGVRVSLIVDGLGSEAAARARFFEPIEAAGVEICRFIPRFGRKYLLRNHQKLALADDARAIIGGFNIKADYFGHEDAAGDSWRDLGLSVEGPAAARLAGYFDALARWCERPKAPIRALNRLLRAWSEEHGRVRWLLGGPTRRLSPWARAVRRELKQARSVDLIAAYFAPGPAMLRRLGKAGRRGRVRIVLPAITDHGMAIWASRFTYAGLLRRGARIFEYLPTKLHSKLIAIDDAVHIGSANFDIRSLFLNLELMLRIEDVAFAAHVRAYVDGEVAASQEITSALHRERMTIARRIAQAAAYFVMAVVDPTLSRTLPFWGERRK